LALGDDLAQRFNEKPPHRLQGRWGGSVERIRYAANTLRRRRVT